MFFHLVVLLSLSWPHVTGTGNADVKDEVAFDQIATASEIVPQKEQKRERKQEFRDQLITSIIDTTVHYENSNGFVPMMVSPSPPPPSDLLQQPEVTSFPLQASNVTCADSSNERNNSSSTDCGNELARDREEDKIENDPAYSTEARIFLNFPNLNSNRRSFEYQGSHNEFELLKVRNDTPVVANYPDLYESPSSSGDDSETSSESKHRTQGKGQKMKEFVGNYGMAAPETNDATDSYGYYYSHGSAKDKEKKSREQEKVVGNYHRQDVSSYDGHGQSATKQNGPSSSPSFPRTNQQVNVFFKSPAKDQVEAYDGTLSTSQIANNHKFSRPVVVGESNFKFEQPSRISGLATDDYQTSTFIDSGSSEVLPRFTIDNRDGRFRSDEDSRDVSDDDEYVEYTERPRRTQKGRRRPSDNSKRLPKEHRGFLDDSAEYESQGKRHHSSRAKSHRQRARGNSWANDDRHQDQDDSYEDTRYDGRLSGSEIRHVKSQSSKFKPSTSWNQISPNLEISHSSGVEIGQLEKPKLIVPVKVNLVPVANFDHATAIGNSQGFDVSNAVLRNIVSATPVSAVSTPTPVITTVDNLINHDNKIRLSTPIPDIIVGHNSFQNSMQTVLAQINDQNKLAANFKPQYVSSTVAPVLAVTPSLNPSLQSIPIQDVHGSATTRPAYVSATNQVSTNHMPQLIVPQPTLQTVPTFMQTPVSSSDYIQVNSHGMHGQNPISHGNLQVHPLPTMPTITPTPQTIPVTKINLITSESQSKKTMLPGSSTNFLASASLAVGHDDQRQTFNGNSFYLQNSNAPQIVKPQVQGGLYQQMKNVNVAPKTKTFIQTTHLLPALLHPMPTFTTLSASTPQLISEQQNFQGTNLVLQSPRDQSQQFLKVQNTGFDDTSTLKSVKLPSLAYQSIDSMGSHSINNVNTLNASPGVSGIENAHLPHVGTRNVEILNPNIKPSPVDTAIINSYETMHYPAAVLTTSIPMFTTTSFVTARPALLSTTTESTNVQNFVNSLAEMGLKNNQPGDLKAYQSQDKPVFNPINFVPNVDVVKNQNALNSKLHASEPLQQNLNLVPLLPGGNFFKPSFMAQSDLLVKPKLSSDLETYAEQMFKESLKTIYNSQKWNNDRKPGSSRQNVSDSSDIAKLKNELQRLKASLSDSKQLKDQIEGHHSETKVQTAELPSKKPDELLAALEQMLKTHPKDSLQSFYGNGKPPRHRRPGDHDKYNFGSSSDVRDSKPVRDFMTPPPASPHRSKGRYHDKPRKKRPGPARFNGYTHHHGPRSHHRGSVSSKMGVPDPSGSNIDPIHAENIHDSGQFRKGSPFDSYPSSSSLSRDKSNFSKGSKHHKEFDSKENQAFNHPKMHNFLGMLMKNKQLPNGMNPSYLREKDHLKQFFKNEKQKMQQEFYDDNLRDYFYKMSEGMLYSNLGHGASDARRSFMEKRTGSG